MPYLNFNSASPTLKLVITIMSVITIGIIVSFIGFLLSRIFFSLAVPEANDVLYGKYSAMTVSQLKYYQMVQIIGFFIIPGFFLQWLFSTPEAVYFSINKKPQLSSTIIVFAVLLLSIPFVDYLINYNRAIVFPNFLGELENKLRTVDASTQSLTNQFLLTNNFGAYLINIIIIAALPAIGEELIFRGIIQKIFSNISRNKHMAVIMAAILFSAIHGQFFGFIPRFVLGVFFGYLMIWSQNIWLPILAHFFNNLIAVTVYYLYSNGTINISPDELGTGILGSVGIVISLLLFISGGYFIYRINKATINHI